MELTRRQFIITASTATAAVALPATYVSATREIKQQFNKFTDFTSKQVEELDKYIVASVMSSIVSMLFLAYTLKCFLWYLLDNHFTLAHFIVLKS